MLSVADVCSFVSYIVGCADMVIKLALCSVADLVHYAASIVRVTHCVIVQLKVFSFCTMSNSKESRAARPRAECQGAEAECRPLVGWDGHQGCDGKNKGKDTSIGKGKAAPVQDPNEIVYTFYICVEDCRQAAGNDGQ